MTSTITSTVDQTATRSSRSAAVAAAAHRIRHHILDMGEVQGQGYVGQGLGAADILATAYADLLRLRPSDPHWEGRDRFLLSTGHYAIGLYAALAEAGVVPVEELETYGSDDSRLPMSGMASYTPGMEISGGSLGHGLGVAVGMDTVQLGIMMIVNLSIGLYHPPIGTTLFITSSIAKVRIGDVVVELIPFYIVAIGLLLGFAYVPALTLR